MAFPATAGPLAFAPALPPCLPGAKHDALPADRILGVETGGCPHTAIREDASMNLAAVAELQERFRACEWCQTINCVEISWFTTEPWWSCCIARAASGTCMIEPMPANATDAGVIAVCNMTDGLFEVPCPASDPNCAWDPAAESSTSALCARLCSEGGYQYMALFDGTNCYCENVPPEDKGASRDDELAINYSSDDVA